MLIFSGTCPRCGAWYQWHELQQELYCLEAKNNGCFGECRRGAHAEEHTFDQECESCDAALQNMNEAGGRLDDHYEPAAGDEIKAQTDSGRKTARKGRAEPVEQEQEAADLVARRGSTRKVAGQHPGDDGCGELGSLSLFVYLFVCVCLSLSTCVCCACVCGPDG